MDPLAVFFDKVLLADPQFIGKVHRQFSSGKSAEEVAKHFGHKNAMNVNTFQQAIRALKGEIPIGDLSESAKKQLFFVSERYLLTAVDPAVRSALERFTRELRPFVQNFASTPKGYLGDSARSIPSSTPVEVEAKPGVYVYSYPQYLSMESVSPNGTAFYKIGASGKVANRIERQARQTEVPEDLVLVRVFYDENPFELEAKFHSILRAANMHQKTTQGGVEWFSCNLATIDAIAKAVNND